ncbi:MAG TPA: DNA recombination protein RmuC, partial [Acidimicrobiales bacterium]|nr:DNA recombination protein RmuC [Acidimicrobiales bacterium]
HQATLRAAVDAAVDTVVKVAGERLGAQTDAGARDLASRQQSFEQRVGELSGALTDQMTLRAATVEQHMGDVRTELARVGELVVTLQRERADQQGRVETRLSEMAAVSARLADTTQSLRQALANPKARGQWGERMADDVLRAAGLVEGMSYRKQSATAAGTIPDFTFLLPGGRVLHMDVKFPVDNYLRYLEAHSDRERDQHAIAFVRDVRARVRELSTRVYIDPDETLDEVLLFIPNEAVYAFVHEHDRDLVEVALRQKVVLCSPSTLFSVLSVIRQAVEQTHLQRTSDEILVCLAGFEQQWGKFADALDKVGRSLDSVRRSWDDLSGTRRRQLERHLDRVGELRTRRQAAGDGVLAAGDAPVALPAGVGEAFELTLD